MQDIKNKITEVIKEEPQNLILLSHGNNAILYAFDNRSGDRLVAKIYSGISPNLDIEGYMLKYLRDNSYLPVPELYYRSPELLIMDYVETSGGLTKNAEVDAAHILAELHSIRGDKFGFHCDTLIGALKQPNKPNVSWIDFFAEERLCYMAAECFNRKIIDKKLFGCIEDIADKLSQYIDEPEYPALIHGDLWQGNILCNNSQITGFIDPAIYYAHPEVELAFSTMFGTFGKPFFDAYSEIKPIDSDFFKIRKDIYNLYPLLVHVRLFAGGYIRQLEGTLKKFL